jgi:hypothetical protein
MAGSPNGNGGVHGSERVTLRAGERSDSIGNTLDTVPLVPGERVEMVPEDFCRQVEGLAGLTVPETSGEFPQRLFPARAYTLHDYRCLFENLSRYTALVAGSKLLGSAAGEKRLAHRSPPSSSFP